MSPSWIWSDKITNERVARVGYNHFISNKGEWDNCFSKLNRVLPPIFISTILQSVRKENLAHYFPYDVKIRLLAHSRSFLANQKARNAIVGAENLLKWNSLCNHPSLTYMYMYLTEVYWLMSDCAIQCMFWTSGRNAATNSDVKFLLNLMRWTEFNAAEIRHNYAWPSGLSICRLSTVIIMLLWLVKWFILRLQKRQVYWMVRGNKIPLSFLRLSQFPCLRNNII